MSEAAALLSLYAAGRFVAKKFIARNTNKKTDHKVGFFIFGAGNEIRTRDPNLGKVVLYQLSYSRNTFNFLKHRSGNPCFQFGAGNEIRTRDPNLGKVVLYQLSYSRSNF